MVRLVAPDQEQVVERDGASMVAPYAVPAEHLGHHDELVQVPHFPMARREECLPVHFKLAKKN